MRRITSLINRILNEWDTLTLPQQKVLSPWFRSLWETFQNEKRLGRTITCGWYQGEKGLELVPLDKGKPPIYRVDMAQLPKIKHLHTNYEPVLANTTAVVESNTQRISRELPDVMSWRLDLWLCPSDGECPVRDGIQFVYYHQGVPLRRQGDALRKVVDSYELDFLGGKKLSAWQAHFVKTIFDKSISKIT